MFVRLFLLALPFLIATNAVAAEEGVPQNEGISMQEWATYCERWDKWDKPAPPFRIHGNTYYVGTCGISAILVLGKRKHVLIDTGTERGTDFVIANFETLGIDPQTISLMLYSHEHFDHVGGHAKFQQLSGASVGMRGVAAITAFKTGLPDESDPQSGMHRPMPTIPGHAVGLIVRADGGDKPLVMGPEATNLTMIETPGHSPGALSWQWESCDKAGDCKTIVYADSLSPVSADNYRFSDHPDYVEDYRKGIARVGALDCDILITPHPSHSNMVRRAATGTFEGGMSCWDYAAAKMNDLDERLAKEAAQGKSGE